MSQDRKKQVLQALEVWRDRGNECLDALSAGRIEEFLKWQKRQQIAFQNFQSLDYIAKADGWDIAQDPYALGIAKDLQQILERIATIHRDKAAGAQEKLAKIGKSALHMRNYGRTHRKAKFIKII